MYQFKHNSTLYLVKASNLYRAFSKIENHLSLPDSVYYEQVGNQIEVKT